MKRLLSILIILSLLLSFTGCKKDKKKEKEDVDDPIVQTPAETPDETPAPSDVIIFNDVNITEYNIVCDKEGLDYNVRAAEYIRNSIAAVTGTTLNIVDDSEAQKAREIVVGETSRQISAELDRDTVGFEFAIKAKDGSFALEADYYVIAAAAYYFAENFIKAGNIRISDGLTVSVPVAKEAKNFILLIGDGMGVYQTMLYDYMDEVSNYVNTEEGQDDYSDGEDYFYGYMLPNLGFSRTNSYGYNDDNPDDRVTDSAAGGTALATGYKTWNEYIGLDRNGNTVKSITELAAELGKSTAVMSTEANTGATPASFSAHAFNRDNSSEIRDSQEALTEAYGTKIVCNFNYYSKRYIKSSIESRIIDTLTALEKNDNGFFLMYEEAHIDKKSHSNDMAGTFLAVVRFNQAIARFMEYAFYNPDTMVIITADHETGGLYPNSDGSLAYHTTNHSSADVPIFAWGKGTEWFNGKTIENIQIPQFMAEAMGVTDFGDKTLGWYTEIYGDGTELPIVPI